MANCPHCGEQMDVMETFCRNCGYDFPVQGDTVTTETTEKKGIAYSALADFALVVGMILSGLGAIISLVGIVVLTLTGNYAKGLIQAPLSFLMSFALYVVFQRAADTE